MAAPTRILPDLIESWIAYMDGLPTNKLFAEWAAVFLVSAALTRRVWVRTSEGMPPTYPNLYVALVGPPGSGKDIAINPVAKLLREASVGAPDGHGFYIGEESLSPKGLIDSIASSDSICSYTIQKGSVQEVVKFQSLIGCVPELGTLIPEYNIQFISSLNELYNCKPHYKDRIRGALVEVMNPHIALFLGTQPETMVKVFPESAFKMGFTSRMILVHANAPTIQNLFRDLDAPPLNKDRLWNNIRSDIRSLPLVSGEMTVAPEAQRALNHFHVKQAAETAVPTSKYTDYNVRRSLHLLKLSMIMALSRQPVLNIELRDVERAQALLFKTEALMPKIFANLVTDRGFHASVEEVVNGNEKTISHQQLIVRLRRRHPPNEIRQVIASMKEAGNLHEAGTGNGGFPIYTIRGDHD